MKSDRNEGSVITKSLICHVKNGAFYLISIKGPMINFKYMGRDDICIVGRSLWYQAEDVLLGG
jgi:hypothetical protein